MPTYRRVPSSDTKPEDAFRSIARELEAEGVIRSLRSQYYIGYVTESGNVIKYIVDFLLNGELNEELTRELHCNVHVGLVVEIKGRKWHSKDKQRRKDELKEKRLKKYGYRVLWFWDDEVFKNRGWVKDQVRATLKEMESCGKRRSTS